MPADSHCAVYQGICRRIPEGLRCGEGYGIMELQKACQVVCYRGAAGEIAGGEPDARIARLIRGQPISRNRHQFSGISPELSVMRAIRDDAPDAKGPMCGGVSVEPRHVPSALSL